MATQPGEAAMNAPLQVRPVVDADFAGWRAMWEGYQQFYKVSFQDDAVRRTWARLLDPAEPMFGAVAVQDGRVVGLVHYILHRSTWTAGDYCYLQDLYVDAACRRQGLAAQLIRSVYEAAEQLGAARVYWLTHESNTTAMQLYDQVAERSGFVQYRHVLPAPAP
ncbi:MAG: GCN5-related N-acetyltransferase [Variovorax sp.]|jgi:GNAT superfamily N-acetyltransferase|nr:GCN5-related N-acetyltransferase [Variovorax sp.]